MKLLSSLFLSVHSSNRAIIDFSFEKMIFFLHAINRVAASFARPYPKSTKRLFFAARETRVTNEFKIFRHKRFLWVIFLV